MSAPTERVDELLAAARDAMERGSYAPYSNFPALAGRPRDRSAL